MNITVTENDNFFSQKRGGAALSFHAAARDGAGLNRISTVQVSDTTMLMKVDWLVTKYFKPY
jgi:hypothetical protein